MSTKDYSANNNRIAKNSLVLYFRMFVSMAISIYTSRIVLEALGVDDYGVYNVVGGVVSLLTFLNGSMAGATSRFINFELGKGSDENLRKIFNSSFCVHIIIALVIVVACETFGLWFLNRKLVIAPASLNAAHWVFQLSVIGMFFNMTQVPYNATIMANEKMSVYAYLDIISAILRLLIAFLILNLHSTRLIIYALLMTAISVCIAFAYRFYCIHHFPYCRLSVKDINLKVIRPMLTFSGWDLYGNLSVVGRTQGIAMLANIFFGTVANAAIGISNQVQGAVSSFASNVTTAIRPQIIKSYAEGDFSYMQLLLFRGAKFAFLIIFIVALPIFIELPFILSIWLKEVPLYTVWICRWTLCFILFSNISLILVTGVHATGNMKGPSLINGTLYLSVVPISYFIYIAHGSIYIPFFFNVLFVIVGGIANFFYTKVYVKLLSFKKFLIDVYGRILLVSLISAIVPVFILFYMPQGWLRLIVECFVSVILSSFITYFIGLNKTEKQFALASAKKIIKKLH